MKKRVRDALKELRGVLDRNGGIDVYGTIDLASLEILVKWAEKKAKRPETLEIGDAVRLVKDIPHGGTVLRKGTTGKVRRLIPDTEYDVEIYMDVVDRYNILAFSYKELEKV